MQLRKKPNRLSFALMAALAGAILMIGTVPSLAESGDATVVLDSQGNGGNPNAGCNQGDEHSGGVYDETCDGTTTPPGNSENDPQGNGPPCDGCVGHADNQDPNGQQPGGGDDNKGYECDDNPGVGNGNPAHTGCEDTEEPPCPEGSDNETPPCDNEEPPCPEGSDNETPPCDDQHETITICHKDGNSGNYSVITIDTDGNDEHGHGHFGHEGDIIPMPEGGCPDDEPPCPEGSDNETPPCDNEDPPCPEGSDNETPPCDDQHETITICHKDGNSGNYSVITIDTDGNDEHGHGHFGHEGDIIPMPEGGCPGDEPPCPEGSDNEQPPCDNEEPPCPEGSDNETPPCDNEEPPCPEGSDNEVPPCDNQEPPCPEGSDNQTPPCDNEDLDCHDLGNCPPPPTCEDTGTCPPPPTCEDLGNCPPPPITDCDSDGVDDAIDPDTTSCEPPVVEENDLCPNVEGMQTEVPGDLEVDADGNCVPPDEVLGEIIHNSKPDDAVQPAVLPSRQQNSGVLPFTGSSSVLPFLMIGLALMLSGGLIVKKARVTS